MRIEDIQEHLDKYNDYDIRQNTSVHLKRLTIVVSG